MINLDPSVKDEQLLVELNLVEEVNDNEWKVSFNTHSFPGVSMTEYQKAIMDSFYNAEESIAPAIVNAYANF